MKSFVIYKKMDTLTISNNMSPNDILLQSRVYKEDNIEASHVSMGNIKGSYHIHRDNTNLLYKSYSKLDKYRGLLEKPLNYTMLRTDLDFKVEPNINEVVADYLNKIRLFLSNNLITFKKNMGDAVILTKPPYLDPTKNIMKYGLHIQFPNVFINMEDFKIFEIEMKLISGKEFDSIGTKPWLMYGQHKNNYAGTYTIKYVDVDGDKIQPEDYFKNYTIYDNITELPIKYTEPIKNYYHQFLSIHLTCRDEVEFKKRKVIVINKHEIEYEVNVDVDVLLDDVEELLDMLDEERVNRYEDWFKIGSILYTTFKGDERALDLWKGWSESYMNYREEELDRKWSSMSESTLKMGTLYFFAKTDNPTKYKYFISKRKKNKEKDEEKKPFTTIHLDNIKPNITINQNDIGSYIQHLDNHNTLMIRSPMMTFKTKNLKDLFNSDKYPRILCISFRRSLDTKYKEEWGDIGFYSYTECKGVIDKARVLVQINSLHKVRGHYDLVVLDEVGYTMDMIMSYCEKRREVWETLMQYLSCNETKFILLDALLNNRTIDTFRKANRDIFIVENTFQSFKGKNVNVINWNSMTDFLVDVEHNVQFGNIFIPVNSIKFAKKINQYLLNKGYSVGMQSSETEIIPPSEWIKYKIFISTPSNTAGVSCSDQFYKTIGYCVNCSNSPDEYAQQLGRVRNTVSDQITIYMKHSNRENVPTKLVDIEKYVNDQNDCIVNVGLTVDRPNNKIIKDDFYQYFIKYTQSVNVGKKFFIQKLKGVLEHHGFSFTNDETEQRQATEEQEQKIINDVKLATEQYKDADALAIVNAEIVTEQEYNFLKNKPDQTPTEQLLVNKYYFNHTYMDYSDCEPLNIKKVQFLYKHMSQFKRVCEVYTENRFMAEYIQHRFIKILDWEKHVDEKDVVVDIENQLLLNMGSTTKLEIDTKTVKHNKNIITEQVAHNSKVLFRDKRPMQHWVLFRLIRDLFGYDNIFDKQTKTDYPYHRARAFLQQTKDGEASARELALVFDGHDDKSNWTNEKAPIIREDIPDYKDMDEKEITQCIKTGKKKIVMKYNTYLKNIYGVTIKNKARRNNEISQWGIVGLENYENHGITLHKNKYIEKLFNSR